MSDSARETQTVGSVESSGGARRSGFALWAASGSYVGFFPILPGTVGTLLGIPLVLALQQLPSLWLQGAVLAAIWIAGVPICTAAAERLGAKDPNAIVLDEILSFPVTFFGLGIHGAAMGAAGFFLFRIFDIVKPPPARQIEALPRGLGIMADDVVAALYAQGALRLLVAAGLLFP